MKEGIEMAIKQTREDIIDEIEEENV